MPVLFFSFSLAVDINSMVLAQNEVSNLAYAGAIAGAYQFNASPSPGGGLIDGATGPSTAISVINAGISAGAASRATIDPSTLSAVVVGTPTYADSEIIVTIQYQVENLLVLGYLSGASSVSPPITVVRTAFACVPGDTSGPTGGFCVAPIG